MYSILLQRRRNSKEPSWCPLPDAFEYQRQDSLYHTDRDFSLALNEAILGSKVYQITEAAIITKTITKLYLSRTWKPSFQTTIEFLPLKIQNISHAAFDKAMYQ